MILTWMMSASRKDFACGRITPDRALGRTNDGCVVPRWCGFSDDELSAANSDRWRVSMLRLSFTPAFFCVLWLGPAGGSGAALRKDVSGPEIDGLAPSRPEVPGAPAPFRALIRSPVCLFVGYPALKRDLRFAVSAGDAIYCALAVPWAVGVTSDREGPGRSTPW